MNKKYFINSWYEEDTQDVENNSHLRSAALLGRCSSAGGSSARCLSSSPRLGADRALPCSEAQHLPGSRC